MSPDKAAKFAVVTSITLFCFCFQVARGLPVFNDTVLFQVCNGEHFEMTLATNLARDNAVGSVLTNALTHSFNYYASSVHHYVTGYGHAACSRELTAIGCKYCLVAAFKHTRDNCGLTIGAQVKMQD